MNERVDKCVRWGAMAAVVVGTLAWACGCESPGENTYIPAPGFYGDPELVALAEHENAIMEARWGVRLDSEVSIEWGAESQMLDYDSWRRDLVDTTIRDRIEISRAERGGRFLREHVRHEVAHLYDGEVDNDLIAAHVASWWH